MYCESSDSAQRREGSTSTVEEDNSDNEQWRDETQDETDSSGIEQWSLQRNDETDNVGVDSEEMSIDSNGASLLQ